MAPRRYSRASRRHLRHLARGGVDVAHVEGHYLLHLLPLELLDRTIVVEHNVESALLAQRIALDASSVCPEELKRLQAAEMKAWRACACVVALTEEDAAAISARAPSVNVRVAGNGWDHLPLRVPPLPAQLAGRIRRPRLLFLGNFGYAPNQDAARWLLERIFPRIRAAIDDVELVLAGANMDADLVCRAHEIPGVEVMGWAPDVNKELDRADVVVCPLRIGGGIKVKTIEALRRGCVVVSTTVGVQGLPPALRAATAVANDATAFAREVVALCRDATARATLLTRLRQAQPLMPTWASAAETLTGLWREIATRRSGGHDRAQALQGALPAAWQHPR